MGSKQVQGELWGQNPVDWASIQEAIGEAGYKHVYKFLNFTPGNMLLDVGCGSGYFSNLVEADGLDVTGIDASAKLVEQARKRNPSIDFQVGEMEDLPFEDHSFDAVCAFNSIQYAESFERAISECKRVLKKSGQLIVMVWGNQDDCDIGSYLSAIRNLMPPCYTEEVDSPFILSGNQKLELILEYNDFKIIENAEVKSTWNYPNFETALKGFLSAASATKAIKYSGYQKVYNESVAALKKYTTKDGRVVLNNVFKVMVCNYKNFDSHQYLRRANH